MIRLIFLSFALSLAIGAVQAQNVHFRSTDQKVQVVKDDLVKIDADTAYIISKARASVLNQKLEELANMRRTNEELHTLNQAQLDKLKEVERLVTKLLEQTEGGTSDITQNLDVIVNELDGHLKTLKENNAQLAETNKAMEQQIAAMDQTISRLKKNIRGIWWNGAADKLVMGIAGLGVGLVIGSL